MQLESTGATTHQPAGEYRSSLMNRGSPKPNRVAPPGAETLRLYEQQAAVISAIADLRALKPNAGAIDRATDISPETFLSRYYAANEPILLEGFVRNWPAIKKWSPGYFAEQFGDVELDVYRDGHRRSMRIRDFVDVMQRQPEAGEPYLVAQYRPLPQSELAALSQDLRFDSAFFDAGDDQAVFGLWMGPANTLTPLHYDQKNVLLAQLYGRKRVKLISPLATDRLYCRKRGYSEVDPDKPDFNRFPLFERVTVSTIELEAGDALFLPFGWWHHVRSLSPSISLSLNNFIWPNSFAAEKL
jgi:hypothetical protein